MRVNTPRFLFSLPCFCFSCCSLECRCHKVCLSPQSQWLWEFDSQIFVQADFLHRLCLPHQVEILNCAQFRSSVCNYVMLEILVGKRRADAVAGAGRQVRWKSKNDTVGLPCARLGCLSFQHFQAYLSKSMWQRSLIRQER